MIDKLQKVAHAIQILRIPSIVVGVGGLAAIAMVLFILEPEEGQRYLIPGIVSLFWGVSAYSFITGFRSVPAKADKSFGLFSRLMRNIHRGGYWLIGVFFLGTTAFVIILTAIMIFIWLKDYAS
ncbi:MAG: hypothetical protein BMS9Abin25_0015 [Gammaproteobacteria bacterium]|nr:MAG: hypothetical protein BMS9Abin25_0015 [Gammaproteobacteria bacterium]